MEYIKDPETEELIEIYSDRFNELLLMGYPEEELLNQIIIPPEYNRSNIFMDDLLYQYMLNLNIKDIKSLCSIDKNAYQLCQSEEFWKNKFIYDGLISFGNYNMKEYIKIQYAINKVNFLIKYNSVLTIYYEGDLRQVLPGYITLDLEEIKYQPNEFEQFIFVQFKTEYTNHTIYIELENDTSKEYIRVHPYYTKDIYDMLIKIFYYEPTVKYE